MINYRLVIMMDFFIKSALAQSIPVPAIIEIGGIYCLFVKALDWFFSFVILLAVYVIISVGVKLLFSEGNADARKQALGRLYFAIAGVAVVLLSWTIVTQVIPGFLGVDSLDLSCSGSSFSIFSVIPFVD